MQNCTHLLSFDICIHPRNHYPNQDNRSIYLLPKVSLCPFIDSFTSTSSLQATAICYLSLWFEFPTVLYKQNHAVSTLLDLFFFSLHIRFLTSIQVSCVTEVPCFLLLRNNLLYGSAICSFFLPLRYFACFTFWLFCKKKKKKKKALVFQFSCDDASISLGQIPKCGISGLHDM